MMTMSEKMRSVMDMVLSLSEEALIFTQGTRQRKREERIFSVDEYFLAKRATAGMKSCAH